MRIRGGPCYSESQGPGSQHTVDGADASDADEEEAAHTMTDTTPAMIVSGVPYEVTGVAGQAPSTLDEFAGPVTMQTQGPTGEHEVLGAGEHPHDGAVRVHEKNHGGTGKDVRVWTVTPALDRDGFDAAG